MYLGHNLYMFVENLDTIGRAVCMKNLDIKEGAFPSRPDSGCPPVLLPKWPCFWLRRSRRLVAGEMAKLRWPHCDPLRSVDRK